ncbi:RusA family crossover junction endodeoxyribonuclease [Herbiconiux sp. UC225_62]|uniref:RusA family crossover junction endodeoxyribonuclease n=1 Tax=Herbiconiux sp. UC225_62 TaxID=3350168 RepID=UPI0036D25B04
MTEIVLVVPGDLVPQGSKKAVMGGGRPQVVDVNEKKLKLWRGQIATAARLVYTGPLILDAVDVRLEFRVPRPKSVSEAKRPWPSVYPDVDKLARAVLDALTGSVFKDDGQVVDLRASKRYADQPSVLIRVRLTQRREDQ